MSGGEGMFIGNFASVDRTEEGDIIPIVVIRPMYPRDAAMKGQEGWVKVEFTITAIGTVKDPRRSLMPSRQGYLTVKPSGPF